MAKKEQEITGGDTGKVAKDPLGPGELTGGMGGGPYAATKEKQLYPHDLMTYARITKELSLIEMEPSYKIKNTVSGILQHIQDQLKKFKEPGEKEEE